MARFIRTLMVELPSTAVRDAVVEAQARQLEQALHGPQMGPGALDDRASRRRDAYGSTWHAPNNPAIPLREFLEQVASPVGARLKLRTAGRLMLRTMGIVNPGMRELVEMLYQFERPVLVSNDKIATQFGLTAMPSYQGLRETVAWARTGASA